MSVRIVRGRTVLVAGSKSTECAVQSCFRVRSLGSFLQAPSEHDRPGTFHYQKNPPLSFPKVPECSNR